MFAQKVNLNPKSNNSAKSKNLAKEGFLQKVGSGYGITEKGKTALKAYRASSARYGILTSTMALISQQI